MNANTENKKDKKILTFIIKLIFLVVLFVGLPYFFINNVNKYEKKASGIVEQQNIIIEIQSNPDKELEKVTQETADTLKKIHDFIKGVWMSEADGRYELVVDDNNKFEEYYDDQKEGFGVWRVFFENSKYYFHKQQFEPTHKGEIYVYEIQQLDAKKFILLFEGEKSKPLVFVRQNEE